MRNKNKTIYKKKIILLIVISKEIPFYTRFKKKEYSIYKYNFCYIYLYKKKHTDNYQKQKSFYRVNCSVRSHLLKRHNYNIL